MKQRKKGICAYCGKICICEKDHVIARQFFPKEEKYRSNLPQVPSCGKCNRQKQKTEDVAGVYFQFGHNSYASKNVLTSRVRKTLEKNAKLAIALRKGLQKRWIKNTSGLIIPGLVIKLSDKELESFHKWFEFIARGLYRFELNCNLPNSHSLTLIKPFEKEQFYLYRSMVINTKDHKKKSYANNEFQYVFAINNQDDLSLWIYSLKSIEVVAVMAGPKCPQSAINQIKRFEWTF